MLRRQEDSWLAREDCNGVCGYESDGGLEDDSAVTMSMNGDEGGDGDSSSDQSEYDDTVRTTIPRKLAGLGSRVPRIGQVRDASIAQRRLRKC